MRHPIQPIEDVNGIFRYKQNEIVSYLLDNGRISMNDLGVKEFDRDDWTQFLQLIGMSVGGAADYDMFDTTVTAAADAMADGTSYENAVEEGLRQENKRLKETLKQIQELTDEDYEN